jgi:hypothetical protein
MLDKKAGVFGAALLGLALCAPLAFADDWESAREEYRKAQDELAKDTRQMNEAASKGDRKGVENERREILEDRQRIANARSRLDSLRGAGNWGGYDPYDDDWGRQDRGWWDDVWRDDESDGSSEWRDAREDLLRAEEELRKDQRELRDAQRRGDWRGVDNERREIEKDHAAIDRARARLASVNGGNGHDRGRHRGWYKQKNKR